MSSVSRVVLVAQVATCALLLAAAIRFAGGAPSAISREPEPLAVSVDDTFPRVVRDSYGDPFRTRKPPERLGSQAVPTDEFLYAIAPSERIVVASPYAADPRYSFVADLARATGPASAQDPESIALRNPDVLFVSHTSRAEYIDQARAIGVPVFRMVTVFDRMEQIASALSVTGYVSGADVAAEREVEQLRERIRAARQLANPREDKIRVLAFSNFAQTLGAGSLFDHIVTDLGAINVAAEQGVGPYGSITSEQVAAWNPDWIVAGVEHRHAESTRNRLLADPGVAVTRAGREGQLLLVENRAYLSMSHHAVVLMEAIAAALHAGDQ